MFERITKNLIPLAIVIAGVCIAGAIIYINVGKCPSENWLSSQEAANKALDFINQNILSGQATASLVDVVEENGLYKMKTKIGEEELDLYVSQDGKLLFPQAINLEGAPTGQPTTQEEQKYTIGNFIISEDEVCKENEMPVIYFFGSKSCPHCTWEHPIVEKVAKDFEGYISFHNNMDSDADRDVFSKYSTGGIPTLVFGCKYYRVGSGEQIGEEESKVLTALICKLTENQPLSVCNLVQDLINQVD
ncbi:hypothetical protein AMJ49_03450 [Parcubacteria bacterium DG_74_2]|nr:MAG: hypothetical protein AMJ49_03450 [Parcubacteria bacterium DG_74_2]